MEGTVKKYAAEAIGTAVLVLVGCGAATIGAGPLGTGIVGIALAFGLAVTMMAFAIGPISGCHINPAVTVGMIFAARIEMSEAVGYIVAQFFGALIGALILVVILKGRAAGWDLGSAKGGLGQNGFGPGYLGDYGMLAAFVVEVVATFIFVSVILGVTHPGLGIKLAGLVIGLTLVGLHLTFINVTGLSVNPARSFGPAIFVGGTAIEQLWLFIVAPVIGGGLAGILYKRRILSP